jgi:hypothetical protein
MIYVDKPRLPSYLSEKVFTDLIKSVTDNDDKKFIKHCFKKENNRYNLNGDLSITEQWRLLEKYIQFCIDIFNIHVAAGAFYKHRVKFSRIGDSDDDYYKAEYLRDMLVYFRYKGTRCISSAKEQQNDMIYMVNNIFDRAFFLKKDFPEKTDIECFTEAERNFCEEKWLDCEAYYEHEKRMRNNSTGDEATDYRNAKIKYAQYKIIESAYLEHRDNANKGISSDEKTDFFKSEENLKRKNIIEPAISSH